MKRKSLAFRIVFIALAVLMVGALVLVALSPLWMWKEDRVSASAAEGDTYVQSLTLDVQTSISLPSWMISVYADSSVNSEPLAVWSVSGQANSFTVIEGHQYYFQLTIPGGYGITGVSSTYVTVSKINDFRFRATFNPNYPSGVNIQVNMGVVSGVTGGTSFTSDNSFEGISSIVWHADGGDITWNEGEFSQTKTTTLYPNKQYVIDVNMKPGYYLTGVQSSAGSVLSASMSASAPGGFIAVWYTGYTPSIKLTTTTDRPILSGYYSFLNEPSLPSTQSSGFSIDLPFTSNGSTFSSIEVNNRGIRYSDSGSGFYAYRGPSMDSSWESGFQSIYIISEVSVSPQIYSWWTSNTFAVSDEVQSLINQAYDEGYSAGNSAGLETGQQAGYNSGYSAGLLRGQATTWENINVVGLFLSPVNSFLSTPLFGSFSIGTAFSVVITVLLGIVFIKMFAGG